VLLDNLREEEKERKRIASLSYLDLCIRHQQRSIGSHYSEHNCDHCKLLKLKEKELFKR